MVSASVHKSTIGDTELCAAFTKYDPTTITYATVFIGCGSADRLTIANGLNSATFSGY
jgi:hypothetical protein